MMAAREKPQPVQCLSALDGSDDFVMFDTSGIPQDTRNGAVRLDGANTVLLVPRMKSSCQPTVIWAENPGRCAENREPGFSD